MTPNRSQNSNARQRVQATSSVPPDQSDFNRFKALVTALVRVPKDQLDDAREANQEPTRYAVNPA